MRNIQHLSSAAPEVQNFDGICSICQEPIPEWEWKYGNNAQPVNDGRCCGRCNTHVVIPARFARFVRSVR